METARILGSLIGISKLNNFEEINNELIPIIEKEICPPEFRNKYYKSHKTGYSFTSDKAGTLLEGSVDSFEALYGDQLQLNKKFNKFFNSLQINLNIFLNNLKYKNVNYYITKSWDRKSTRLNSSHGYISYAVFCLKKKKKTHHYSIMR